MAVHAEVVLVDGGLGFAATRPHKSLKGIQLRLGDLLQRLRLKYL